MIIHIAVLQNVPVEFLNSISVPISKLKFWLNFKFVKTALVKLAAISNQHFNYVVKEKAF